jgi:hypothetical protein
MNYLSSIFIPRIPLAFSRTMILVLLGIIYGQAVWGQESQRIDGGTLPSTDQPQTVAANGHSYTDFIIPANAAGKYLYLNARGADGGYAHFKGGVFHPNADYYGNGGQGANAGGAFRIGTGAKEIPPGSTLRFIIGAHGESKFVDGGGAKLGGGGGGGTGILFLPPSKSMETAQANDWVILAVAGGGGGGWANSEGAHHAGLPGNSGPNGTFADDPAFMEDNLDKFGENRNGGTYFGGFGGGGTNPKILNGCTRGNANYSESFPNGGFQVFQVTDQSDTHYSVDLYVRPVGGYDTNPENAQYGGFGFGGGGSSTGIGLDLHASGAGGGYSGGIGGINDTKLQKHNRAGGGGGSFANATYALPGTAFTRKNGSTSNPGHGEVRYQLTTIAPVSLSFFDHAKPSGANEVLLHSGDYKLIWQVDGNLVLYDNATPKWASHTNGKGATECTFQGDGNLVIYAGSQAIWASGTDAGHHDGKGGKKLVLSLFGTFSMLNADNQVMWSVN